VAAKGWGCRGEGGEPRAWDVLREGGHQARRDGCPLGSYGPSGVVTVESLEGQLCRYQPGRPLGKNRSRSGVRLAMASHVLGRPASHLDSWPQRRLLPRARPPGPLGSSSRGRPGGRRHGAIAPCPVSYVCSHLRSLHGTPSHCLPCSAAFGWWRRSSAPPVVGVAHRGLLHQRARKPVGVGGAPGGGRTAFRVPALSLPRPTPPSRLPA